MNHANPAPASLVVIFGATSDLTKRKLLPAITNLDSKQLLDNNFTVVCVGRSPLSTETYRENMRKVLPEYVQGTQSKKHLDRVIDRLYYVEGNFLDPKTYTTLDSELSDICKKLEIPANYLFYLAVPPSMFPLITEQLKTATLTDENEGSWRRIIIEKPFGHDLASAKALNASLHKGVEEHQIYRIDHYLGKETVQNILAYRFANSTVEPIWNHRYIDHVQITVAESLGVENRAAFYEEAGALRDMVPNHLLALLSIVTMEPPNSLDAEAVRDEQTKVLRAIQPMTPEDVLTRCVRGQYGPGDLRDGTQVRGYREEPGVNPESNIETFVAMKLMIDSWRWVGVPFYIRTGKRMPERLTEIVIKYKYGPNTLFKNTSDSMNHVPSNQLVIRIQPTEGIDFRFNAKKPGPSMHLNPVVMDFQYSDFFGNEPQTGYETLIYDCLNGDATLFKRADNIEIGWELMEPVLDVWSALPERSFPNYMAGSEGPSAARLLLEKDGREWRHCNLHSGHC